MKKYFILSLVCGITPLVVGVASYLMWSVNQNRVFEEIGVYTIFWGVILFIAGSAFLSRYVYLAYKEKKKITLPAFLSGIILFSNFPAAFLILQLVFSKIGESTLICENNSSKAVSELIVISIDQNEISLGSIKPNTTKTFRFRIKSEGSVEYKVIIDKEVSKGRLFGYVTGGMGANAKLVIHSTGHIVNTEI